jgi:predicted nicotinamide N-methyase
MTKDSFIQAVQFIWIQGGSLTDKRIRTLNLLNQYEAETEQSAVGQRSGHGCSAWAAGKTRARWVH